MAKATLVEIMKFFGIDNAAAFRKEWVAMTPQDKEDISSGIGNGTLTY